MATMQDVADRAHVSLSTVSYTLTGKRSISAATRARVEQAMADLDYQRHAVGRALASRRTHVLALAYPVYGVSLGATLNEIVSGAVDAARAADYDLVLWPVSSAEPELLRELAGQRTADGVVLMEVALEDPRIDAVESVGLPCAMVGRTAEPGERVWVDTDFDDALEQAVDHLAGLGHRKIAFVTQPQSSTDAGYGPAVRAELAYERSVAVRGLPSLMVHSEVSPPAGRRAMASLLADAPDLTAVIVMNELALFGVASALREAGRRVPGDVSLMGIVIAEEISEMHERPLTYLAPPGREQGARVVHGLLEVLDGRAAPPGASLPCVLHVRSTTGPAPPP